MRRQPTFRDSEDNLLIGRAAVSAWSAQRVRCACGTYGGRAGAVSGTCNDMPAKWLGCDHCSGSAVGYPLVYRSTTDVLAELGVPR